MSADVKKHLRHRTEIHLYRPEEQPGMAEAVEEGSAGAEISDPAKVPGNSADSSSPRIVFSSQSKSVKP